MRTEEVNIKKEIGVFSGSFNPVHSGHVMLASYMCQYTYLDEVWITVTPHNPLKESDNLLDDSLRLEMAKLAFMQFENIKVSDVEFSMPRPSYTIDTLIKLSEDHPDKIFTLIIGADNWSVFDKWKEYKKLASMFKILIYPRYNSEVIIPDYLQQTVRLADAPLLEISSTFIRNGISENKNMRGFVPDQVYDLIEKNHIYK